MGERMPTKMPRGFYHIVMLKIYELCEGDRFISIRELKSAFPQLEELKNYRGTKRLSAAIRWLEQAGLLEVDNKWPRRFRPKLKKEKYLEEFRRVRGWV